MINVNDIKYSMLRLICPSNRASRQRRATNVFARSWLILLLCLSSLGIQAEDRALIIGISEYLNPTLFAPYPANLDVPNVVKDIEMARSMARVWGIDDANIKVLQDEAATAWNIRYQLKHWLGQSDEPQDRVFLYYSGHGAKSFDESGDEADYLDEVLLAHDAFFATQETGRQLHGVVLDDELYALLNQLPSRRKVVMIDACFGAGLYRADASDDEKGAYNARAHALAAQIIEQDQEAIKKKEKRNTKAQPPTMIAEVVSSTSNMPGATRAWSIRHQNYQYVEDFLTIKGLIFLSAAAETEKAWHSKDGGLFTRSLYQGMVEKGIQGPVTPTKLQAFSDQFIKEFAKSKPPQHPQLIGDKSQWHEAMF